MREWWLERTPREQTLLGAGLAVLLFLLVYLAVWEPLQRNLQTSQAQVEQLQADLAWMQAAAARRPGAQSTSSPATGESLASLIEQSVRRAELADRVKRIEARSREDVQIVFEAAPFDDLLLWLEALARQNAVRVAQASVDATPQAGLVNARLVLQRG